MQFRRSLAGVLALLMTTASPMAYAGSGPSIAPSAIYAPAPVKAAPRPLRLPNFVKGGIRLLATVYTNAGTAITTNRVAQAGTAAKNIGWGTGTNAAAVTDTALQTEAAPTTSGGRTVGTESRTTVTVTNDNNQVVGTVTAGGILSITEAGVFDAVTAGNLWIRSVFTAVGVVSGDSIAFTFGLQQIAG